MRKLKRIFFVLVIFLTAFTIYVITVNRNSVPNDPRPPMVTSGVRIGTPALATRGFGAEQFTEVAEIIAGVLVPNPDIAALRARTRKLTEAFPLYSGLENW